MATTVPANNSVLVTPHEAELARDVLNDLDTPDGFLSVGNETRKPDRVPPEIGRLLQHVLEAMAAGHTVTVSSMPPVLTTSSAAAVLGVSRPTLMRLIAEEELAAHKVGTHHRLRTEDVLEFERRRRLAARAAFESLRDELD